MAWCWWAWLQIWPNLAASCIWAPAAFTAHHFLIRRHINRLAAKMDPGPGVDLPGPPSSG